MTEGLEALTTATLSLALDAASARHQLIAANIANHATPGYVPMKLDFAEQMEAARRAVANPAGADTASLAAVPVRAQPVLDAAGQPVKVHLDAEVAEMAQNAVHYQALARALNRHLSILAMAASDGKR